MKYLYFSMNKRSLKEYSIHICRTMSKNETNVLHSSLSECTKPYGLTYHRFKCQMRCFIVTLMYVYECALHYCGWSTTFMLLLFFFFGESIKLLLFPGIYFMCRIYHKQLRIHFISNFHIYERLWQIKMWCQNFNNNDPLSFHKDSNCFAIDEYILEVSYSPYVGNNFRKHNNEIWKLIVYWIIWSYCKCVRASEQDVTFNWKRMK